MTSCGLELAAVVAMWIRSAVLELVGPPSNSVLFVASNVKLLLSWLSSPLAPASGTELVVSVLKLGDAVKVTASLNLRAPCHDLSPDKPHIRVSAGNVSPGSPVANGIIKSPFPGVQLPTTFITVELFSNDAL